MFEFVEQDISAGLIILFACCVFTVLASFLDLWTKMEALRAAKKMPESRPLLKTGQKIVDYYRMIFYVLMADVLGYLCFNFYAIPYCVVLITVGILFREGLSMKENYELKKSKAIESLEFAAKIVECISKEDAEKLIEAIGKRSTAKHRDSRGEEE